MVVQVGRQTLRSPLAAYAEEDGGAGTALGEGEVNGHGIAQYEIMFGEVAARTA